PGVVAELVVRAGTASRDILCVLHQYRQLVGARRHEAVIAVARPGLVARKLDHGHAAGHTGRAEKLSDLGLQSGDRAGCWVWAGAREWGTGLMLGDLAVPPHGQNAARKRLHPA